MNQSWGTCLIGWKWTALVPEMHRMGHSVNVKTIESNTVNTCLVWIVGTTCTRLTQKYNWRCQLANFRKAQFPKCSSTQAFFEAGSPSNRSRRFRKD